MLKYCTRYLTQIYIYIYIYYKNINLLRRYSTRPSLTFINTKDVRVNAIDLYRIYICNKYFVIFIYIFRLISNQINICRIILIIYISYNIYTI